MPHDYTSQISLTEQLKARNKELVEKVNKNLAELDDKLFESHFAYYTCKSELAHERQ
jgi:hypothetical protein